MNTNWSVQCTMYILEGKVGKNKSIIICVANTIGSFFLCYQWLWATYMQTRMNNMLNVKSTNCVHFACIMCWKWKKFIFHSQQMQRIALLINKSFVGISVCTPMALISTRLDVCLQYIHFKRLWNVYFYTTQFQ